MLISFSVSMNMAERSTFFFPIYIESVSCVIHNMGFSPFHLLIWHMPWYGLYCSQGTKGAPRDKPLWLRSASPAIAKGRYFFDVELAALREVVQPGVFPRYTNIGSGAVRTALAARELWTSPTSWTLTWSSWCCAFCLDPSIAFAIILLVHSFTILVFICLVDKFNVLEYVTTEARRWCCEQ